MTWQIWARGLAAAAIGGGATTAGAAVGMGHSINWEELGVVFLSGALVALLAYLARSPLPGPDSLPGGQRATDPPAKGGR